MIDGEDNKFKAFDDGLKEADEVNDLLNKAGDDPLNLITPQKPKGNFLMRPGGEEEWDF